MNTNEIKQVSIVIPIYNEVDNIAPLFSEISAVLEDEYGYEVLFVDDGSDDGSQEKLDQLAKQHSQIRVIKHPQNRGQSNAIISGVKAARYLWTVTLDGDGQNDPADIPRLISTLNQHQQPAVVVGHRHKRNDPWLKRVSSKIANKVRRSLLHDDCPDTSCSLKLFPRDEFLKLPHFNHLHRFLPALFKRAGLNIINTPVNHRPRTRGKSKYGVNNRLWVGIYDLLGVRWLLKRPCQNEID
ncbi:MAG: glycosyltransferase family 2 protein [Gammaproteobacteria bacterium]